MNNEELIKKVNDIFNMVNSIKIYNNELSFCVEQMAGVGAKEEYLIGFFKVREAMKEKIDETHKELWDLLGGMH